MSVADTIYPKLHLCVGTRSLKERGNLLYQNLTVLTHRTLTHIRRKNSNGSKITIGETPTFQFANYTANLEKIRDIQGIPALFTAFSCASDSEKKVESTKKKSKHNKNYDTPTVLGIKWQLDVKVVPAACYSGKDGEKFYQYTMIDEASRERFIYPYREQSGYSSVDFVKRAIAYFGYAPETIQTDNGCEFCNTQKTKRVHYFDAFLNHLGITHKTIRPRTPWHNGKVERSHRNDQERFYNHLKFYSYYDLLKQMKAYLYRSNRIPMAVLGWKTPIQMRAELVG